MCSQIAGGMHCNPHAVKHTDTIDIWMGICISWRQPDKHKHYHCIDAVAEVNATLKGKSLSVENTDSELDIHSSQHEYIA